MQNRSFYYGEAVCTTLLCVDGALQFWAEHLARLQRGAKFLFKLKKNDGLWSELERNLTALIKMPENKKRSLGIRIDLYRNGQGGGILNESFESVEFLITKRPCSRIKKKLVLAVAKSIKVKNEIPCYLKNPNYLTSLIELKKAVQFGFNDVVYLDEKNNFCEASTSNIFFVIGRDKIITPKLDSGKILAGVARDKWIQYLKIRADFKVFEIKIGEGILNQCNGIFLSNSINYLQAVQSFDCRGLKYNYSKKMLKQLNELKRDFCQYYNLKT